jgi:hypothetical protein
MNKLQRLKEHIRELVQLELFKKEINLLKEEEEQDGEQVEPVEPNTPQVEPAEPTEPEQPNQPEKPNPEEEPKIRIKYVNKVEAERILRGTNGKIFTCLYVKRDGAERLMNCRLGVRKYLKGGELPYDARSRGLLPVFDMKKGAYRIINLNTIKYFKLGSDIYEVR